MLCFTDWCVVLTKLLFFGETSSFRYLWCWLLPTSDVSRTICPIWLLSSHPFLNLHVLVACAAQGAMGVKLMNKFNIADVDIAIQCTLPTLTCIAGKLGQCNISKVLNHNSLARNTVLHLVDSVQAYQQGTCAHCFR